MFRTYITLFCILFSSLSCIKLKNNPSITTHNTTSSFPSFKLKNCYSYAISSDYSEYGCIECSPNTTLITSFYSGTGICKESKAFISSCINQFKINNDSLITCLECSKGYSLAPNGTSCLRMDVNETNKIENCKTYVVDPFGDLLCNRCESGFTLSDDSKHCNSKCSIENCDNCYSIYDEQYCLFCKKDYIGIYGGEYNTILECVNNDELIKGMMNEMITSAEIL